MNHLTLAAALGALAFSGTAAAGTPMFAEKAYAHAEEQKILHSPIAGIENHRWFDYRSNIGEAKKELTSDLRRATDFEDQRDAWEEYGDELADERIDYAKEMAERGFRDGRVTVGR